MEFWKMISVGQCSVETCIDFEFSLEVLWTAE